ncbi:carbonic anhydrase [Myxococcus sp. CA051A]|uniref:carbonic anhydrase n=1 Tax=Myxococcus llanfairpwllgwyngyllgogerychwyrndrobwllllantysiliogogogochensis TaxID=2590453 RepID=A0A540WJU9_9BACT|nr:MULTISPECIES: carbonic anhydrase [Myxococcus]NTX08489.1 carbonic anhydrase [Myxococcus sp. CA040A]NTX16764.1 carbonic anhydrase [Myxococcus sp. CA056]NTX41224.1 carbonic anhydrase [Myxococcus sp. CA033]NTX53776.1 carbonic anhydrase [Myxococcus sp. CA039A]NTX66992.1 carbonic anhydrase [Myxococcus sp. CA051A]
MKKLIRGLLDFQLKGRPAYREVFARLAQGQSPDCIFISCSDSRLVPNLLVTTDPGDLFVVRNVGNLVPPSDAHGVSTGDQSEPAALEFGLSNLEVEDVVVCGHSSCGAMKALLAGGQVPGAPNLQRWLEHGQQALRTLKEGTTVGEGLPEYDRLSQLNVLQQLQHVSSYPVVKERIAAGKLRLHGWWFDIANAQVHVWRPTHGRFIPMTELVGEALLRELGGDPLFPGEGRAANQEGPGGEGVARILSVAAGH